LTVDLEESRAPFGLFNTHALRPGRLPALARTSPWRYVVQRVLAAIPVLFGVAVLTFSLLHLVPGDPARTLLGIHAPQSAVSALRRQLGLDEPLWRQFWHYLDDLVHGNLGTSIYYDAPTSSLILSRLPVTASLVGVATLFSLVITLPLAVLAAARQNKPADHAVRFLSLLGLGMPSFWFGIILLLLFAVSLHVFPVGGWGTTVLEHLRSLVLPGLTAAIGICPVLIRSLRVGMLDLIDADFVAACRAKGLRNSYVLVGHVARNAMIPTLSLLGVNIAFLIGETVVIEQVFNLNGLGLLMLSSIDNRDFPVVQGIAVIYALGVVAINIITDLLTAWLDPRVRLG